MAQAKAGWHVLSNIDPDTKTAICAVCGPVKVIYKPRKNEWRCWIKYRSQQTDRKRRKRGALRLQRPDDAAWDYLSFKGNVCELCGFEAEHPCQLDVDHIVPKSLGGTGEPSNLQTLCANCHRLKSYKERLMTNVPPPRGGALTLW